MKSKMWWELKKPLPDEIALREPGKLKLFFRYYKLASAYQYLKKHNYYKRKKITACLQNIQCLHQQKQTKNYCNIYFHGFIPQPPGGAGRARSQEGLWCHEVSNLEYSQIAVVQVVIWVWKYYSILNRTQSLNAKWNWVYEDKCEEFERALFTEMNLLTNLSCFQWPHLREAECWWVWQIRFWILRKKELWWNRPSRF